MCEDSVPSDHITSSAQAEVRPIYSFKMYSCLVIVLHPLPDVTVHHDLKFRMSFNFKPRAWFQGRASTKGYFLRHWEFAVVTSHIWQHPPCYIEFIF